MNKRLAARLFNDAHILYRGKNYAAALELLNRLDAAFPNAHRIMYPRAMCLAEVGRVTEALAICDRLIHRHKYKRAKKLRSEIARFQKVTAAPAEDRRPPKLLNRRRGLLRAQHSRVPFAVAPPPEVATWHSRSGRFLVALVVSLAAAAASGGYYLYNEFTGVPGVEAAGPSASARTETARIP